MLSARVQVSAAAGSNRSASLACRAVPCPRPALHCRPCTCHPSPQVHRATVVCSASKPAPKGFGAQTAVVKEPAIKDGQACPCGAGKTYAECCQPLHSGAAAAAGPEQLLRARYSAYYGKVIDYVVDTTHPESPEYQVRRRRRRRLERRWSGGGGTVQQQQQQQQQCRAAHSASPYPYPPPTHLPTYSYSIHSSVACCARMFLMPTAREGVLLTLLVLPRLKPFARAPSRRTRRP